jgi:hypothetical protein
MIRLTTFFVGYIDSITFMDYLDLLLLFLIMGLFVLMIASGLKCWPLHVLMFLFKKIPALPFMDKNVLPLCQFQNLMMLVSKLSIRFWLIGVDHRSTRLLVYLIPFPRALRLVGGLGPRVHLFPAGATTNLSPFRFSVPPDPCSGDLLIRGGVFLSHMGPADFLG